MAETRAHASRAHVSCLARRSARVHCPCDEKTPRCGGRYDSRRLSGDGYRDAVGDCSALFRRSRNRHCILAGQPVGSVPSLLDSDQASPHPRRAIAAASACDPDPLRSGGCIETVLFHRAVPRFEYSYFLTPSLRRSSLRSIQSWEWSNPAASLATDGDARVKIKGMHCASCKVFASRCSFRDPRPPARKSLAINFRYDPR